MAESTGRLEVQYFDGSNWVSLTESGNSLLLELEIDDKLYNPQQAKLRVSDVKDNGIFDASSTNSVLKEFMNIRIVDPVRYIIYFSGKIFRMTKKFDSIYGSVIEAVCYDPLYSLGNEFLDEGADSIATTKASVFISTWISNHISTSLLSTANDSGDVDRFEESAYNRANTSKVVKAGRSQISVLAAILQEAIQDQLLTTKDRGYVYYVDPNFTSTATSHNPAGFFTYYPRNRMPALEGVGGEAAPSGDGLTIERPDGNAQAEAGQKHLMMSELDMSSSNRELVTDIIANYYHEETGKRVSKRFSIIHFTAHSGINTNQYDTIGFDATVGTGGTEISNLVDSGGNIIGRIQYMSSLDRFPAFMILSDRTSHALVAGETLSADSHGSGASITLSSVATLGSQYVYEPKAVWGVTKTLKANFDKESTADEIRTKLAAMFEGRQNVPTRLSFSTSQLPYYWAQGRATSSTTGSTLHDSAVNWESKGVRTGATFLKLSGDGGTVSAYGYVSSLTDAGVITCALNTGTWSVNDYYRWQVRVRAGHQIFVKCVPKGISGEGQIVTRVRIIQNMGSQTQTHYETQGTAARSIPTQLAESTTSAANHSAVNTGSTPPVPIGDVPAKLTCVFTPGAKSSPDGTRHYALNWTAGTLKLNKNLTIEGNETDEYTINNNDTTSIVGVGRGSPAALTPDTEYTLYFDPDVDPNDLLIAETSDYESVDRSRLKIGRVLPVTANSGSGAGKEAEIQFELQSTIVLEGPASGDAGASMKLGGDYFAVDGIQAKHMLTVGSDDTSGVRFKFSTPANAANAAWFRGFTSNSNADTTGKWFEFDVANEDLNFYNGATTSLLMSQFSATGLTFYDGSATTAGSSTKLVEVTSTGINMKQTSAGIPALRFGNTNISAGNEGSIGLRSTGTANTPITFAAPADINDSTAFSFEVENASYGSGTSASTGTLKLNFGHTANTDAHLWLLSGREGSDFTIRNNLADTDGNGTTDPGNLILDNFKSLVVEDGTDTAPSITFAGSAGKDTGIFEYETGGFEYLGVTVDGVIAAYFGDSTKGHWFYEALNSESLYPRIDDTYDIGASSYRYDDIYATSGTVNTSDAREKEKISPSTLGLSFINDLNPVSYKWKKKKENKLDQTHYGIIAQEVMETLKKYGIDSVEDFGGITHDGGEEDHYGARYAEFIPILIKAVQELSDEVKQLKEQK